MKLSDFGNDIAQVIENIKIKICDNYCKHTESAFAKYKNRDEALDHLCAEHCDSCPLNFL